MSVIGDPGTVLSPEGGPVLGQRRRCQEEEGEQAYILHELSLLGILEHNVGDGRREFNLLVVFVEASSSFPFR
jgi:hypothetical protein